MGAVNTTYTFTATDTITSTKMNNIIDQTTMTSDAITGTTLEIASGKLRARAGGITSNELASNAVTTVKITDDAVNFSKIQNSATAGLSVIGRNSTGSANFAEISAGTDGHVLRRSGSSVGFGQILTAGIADSAVTAAKLNGAQTGSAPVFGIRAWVTFDMTRDASGASNTLNTNRFIYSDGNVTSVTKTGTGEFTINFTTALPNSNYAYSGSGLDLDSGGDVAIGRVPGSTKTASSIALKCVGGFTGFNFTEVTVMIVG